MHRNARGQLRQRTPWRLSSQSPMAARMLRDWRKVQVRQVLQEIPWKSSTKRSARPHGRVLQVHQDLRRVQRRQVLPEIPWKSSTKRSARLELTLLVGILGILLGHRGPTRRLQRLLVWECPMMSGESCWRIGRGWPRPSSCLLQLAMHL